VLPIRFSGFIAGILNICTTRAYRTWPENLIPRLRLFGEIFVNALMRKQSEEKLQKALSEIQELKERFEADYLYLTEEINLEHDFGGVVGQSKSLRNILVKVKQVAPTNVTVLVLGETGVGKGLIARAIHNASSRNDRPLMQVNCAALAPSLIESELFGHEKGAFTGATTRRLGRFEAAKGTTLFLDEIGDLPQELQPKLLRVLEEGEFERVGGSNTIRTDVRVIAATSKDLEQEVNAGRFRRDLWYRLNIFPIFVPPLRERIEDIPLFVTHFVDICAKRVGKRIDATPVQVVQTLQAYSWPGNIRELKNVIERAVIISPDGNLSVEMPVVPTGSVHGANVFKRAVQQAGRKQILKALEESRWVIEGSKGAALRLGLSPGTFRYHVRKFGIKRPG
jgi:formate hydrogenlyase transcriptional activator